MDINATTPDFMSIGIYSTAAANVVDPTGSAAAVAANATRNVSDVNGSGSNSSLAKVIGVGFVGVLLMAVTVVGNFLVIASYRVNRRLRTINNMFLVSLACSDLVIGIVSMTLYPIYMISRTWYLGPELCDIWLCLDYTLSMASVANLLLICLDRYFSITRPFTYRAKRTRRRTRIFIVSAWVLSMLLWSPAIIIWPRVRGRKSPDDQCLIQFFEDRTITLVTAILAFYLPVLVMSVLYALIYRETTKCSQYLEYLKSYRRARSSSVASPFLNFRKHTGGGRVASSTHHASASSGRNSRSDQAGRRSCNSSSVTSGSIVKARAANSHADRHVHLSEGKLPGSLSNSQNELGAGEVFADGKGDYPNKTHRAIGLMQFNLRSLFSTRTSKAKTTNSRPDASRPGELLVPNACESNRNSRLLCPTPSDATTGGRRSPIEGGKRPPAMPSSDRKAGRTLSAILLAFIVTWLPYNVCVVYKSFCMREDGCIPIEVWDAAYYLCYINSTINPFCFALCNKTFRQTFVQLLSCRTSRSSQVKDFPTTTKARTRFSARAPPHQPQPSSSSSKST